MVESIRKQINDAMYSRNVAQLGIEKNQAALLRLEAEKINLDNAQALIQRVALETQDQIKYSLEDIVNIMLDAMFPDMYTFQLVFEIKRNRTEARIAILDRGQEVDALESLGGGVCDCIATSLRIALLLLTNKRRTVVLDEPSKFLSEDVKPVFYEILKKLAVDLKIQIIMVTHEKLAMEISDRIFTVKKDSEGYSTITT